MESFIIPAEEIETELKVANSRFIASLSPANSVESAREFHNLIKHRFPDATHHVPAFVIGHGNSVISHCSDDGEPSGTAGRPALAVLQGSGLGNVVVVVTRYFGGTKLGTGGLVKAYGDAVKEVLKQVKLAELVPTSVLLFTVPYSLLDQTFRIIQAEQGQILDAQYAADVSIRVRFKNAHISDFEAKIVELSAGKVYPKVTEQDPQTIFPLK